MILVNVVFMALLHSASGLASDEAPGSGVFWGVPKLASTTAYNGAFIPVLEADSNGRLLMVYNQDTVPGDGAIENPYYRESSDGGRTWSQPSPIHVSGLALFQAKLGFDDQNQAHAVWRTDTEIWHSREAQWPNTANRITPITSTIGVQDPDMFVDSDGVIHVVWSQADFRIYYARSEDGGDSWSEGTAVANSGNWSTSPAIAVDDDGNVHVVWDERIYDCQELPCSIRNEVHYTSGISESQGINWTGLSTLLSEGVEKAVQPDIFTQGEDIHVVFARRVGIEPDVDQYAYYMSYSPGSGWSTPIDVTHDPVTVHSNLPLYLDPSLVPCDDALYVYFHGAPTEVSNEVIMGAADSDGWTKTYSAEVGNARAIRPSVVCLGGKMHMVYERVIFPNSDHQIYYMSGNRFALYLPFVTR